MKKRIVAAVLAGTLALGLAACGSSTASNTSADTTVAEETADTEGAGDDAEAAETTEVRTIKAATAGAPRPFIYLDENNNPTGYDIEVLKAVFENLPQYELEIEVSSVDAIFTGILSGQYQIAVNNFSYSDQRAESYLFSLPYDKLSYVFVYPEDEEPITTLSEAAGKSIEGGAGSAIVTAIENWNTENADQQIDLRYTESDMIVWLEHVADGTTDFAIFDTASYYAYAEEYGLEGLSVSPMSDEDTKAITENNYTYLLLPKEETELRDAIDEQLVILQENGTLTELGQEYQQRDDAAPEAEQMVSTPN